MSPKVTLSVPEDLSKKMERWKHRFNFSSIFQEAISSKIEKKENFAKKIKEDPKMDAVIERFRQEKMDAEKGFYEIGRKDGLVWAKQASYRELKYVVDRYKAMFEIRENIISYNPTGDEILGDYFKDIFEEYQDQNMGYEETISPNNIIPNEIFQSWEKGWKEAIEEFWEEIKDKI